MFLVCRTLGISTRVLVLVWYSVMGRMEVNSRRQTLRDGSTRMVCGLSFGEQLVGSHELGLNPANPFENVLMDKSSEFAGSSVLFLSTVGPLLWTWG